jgi:hypothetical protein
MTGCMSAHTGVGVRALAAPEFRVETELIAAQVRKTPSWLRTLANFSLLSLYSHRNAWANLHLLGQRNTVLAASHSWWELPRPRA